VPLPTFFIIGAPKCGTTSLHAYLDRHPEIGMSSKKEPHFFVGPENIAPPAQRVPTLEEYEALFDERFVVRGEASPSYAEHPRHTGAPQRIKALVPDAKFLYLVRDPVDRCISHYQHRVSMEGERRGLGEALGDLRDPCSPYTCAGFYASQLERYLRLFPQERMLVVDQADLLGDRNATLREIFDFLGVDVAYRSSEFESERGATRDRRVYSPGYVRVADSVGGSTLVGCVPRSVRKSLRRAIEQVLWPPLEPLSVDDSLRARLSELYADEADRLRKLTGKALATWSV
jgi:Sulfotransferase domain